MLEKGERGGERNRMKSTWRIRFSRVKEGLAGPRSEKYFENIGRERGNSESDRYRGRVTRIEHFAGHYEWDHL